MPKTLRTARKTTQGQTPRRQLVSKEAREAELKPLPKREQEKQRKEAIKLQKKNQPLFKLKNVDSDPINPTMARYRASKKGSPKKSQASSKDKPSVAKKPSASLKDPPPAPTSPTSPTSPPAKKDHRKPPALPTRASPSRKAKQTTSPTTPPAAKKAKKTTPTTEEEPVTKERSPSSARSTLFSESKDQTHTNNKLILSNFVRSSLFPKVRKNQ
jgi:hypothetical protein